MSRGTTLLKALLLSTAFGAPLAGSMACAQQVENTPQAIAIAPQSLEGAIESLAEQTDLVIVAPSGYTQNLRSGAVSGEMTPLEALETLLSGTNLTYRVAEGGAIVIEPIDVGAAAPEDLIIVTGRRVDPLDQLQKSATESLTGLSRTLMETPRSASRVSEITIDRLGMENVDDLLAAVPGTYTASFFGVPGNLNVRGTLADTYYQGFKRIENRGNYSSNLDSAAYIEVLRGPSSPIYGPGKVGGLLNFIPKTARSTTEDGYVDSLTGSVTATYGSYDKKVIAGEVAIPAFNGGFHLFGEYENSGAYYDNIDPESLSLQGTFVTDLAENWSFEANAMYFDESGRIQTPGWNRVTQELIDNGTYITGRDTDIQDTDGDGYLSYGEIDAVMGAYGGTSNLRQIAEYYGSNQPEFALDEGVGTTKLDGNQIFADTGDYNDTTTLTGYASLSRTFNDDSHLDFEIFSDHVENQRFNSFGFAADYEATAVELRGSYTFHTDAGGHVSADTVIGAAYRTHEAQQYESFLSGYLAFDRRDLSYGATANDRILSPLTVDGEPQWDSRYDMEWNSKAAFGVSDITMFDRLSFLLGVRYDYFDLEAINTGETVFGIADTLVEDEDGATTWSVSARYETPFGLTPYVTYAEPRSLESTQTGGVSTGTINAGLYISPSELKEAGVKFSLMDGNIFGSVAYYDQYRRQTDSYGNVDGTTSEGVEAELHWLATDNIRIMSSATVQETRVVEPGAGNGEYLQVRPDQFGVDNVLGYGGTFAFNNAGYVESLADGYKLTTMPDNVFSLYGTYTFGPFDLQGQSVVSGVTFGATYVSETSGIMEDDIVLPEYTLAKLAGFVDAGPVLLSVKIDNLFDERYFTPSAEVYKEVAVMPGLPRTYSLNLKYSF